MEDINYYPFGLTMNGISSKALAFGGAENKYKFNDGTELNSTFDLHLYETNFRSLDPQIGRFWQLDPMADAAFEYSPFVYGNNNPLTFNDPLGLFSEDPKETSTPDKPKELDAVVVTGVRKISQQYLPYITFNLFFKNSNISSTFIIQIFWTMLYFI